MHGASYLPPQSQILLPVTGFLISLINYTKAGFGCGAAYEAQGSRVGLNLISALTSYVSWASSTPPLLSSQSLVKIKSLPLVVHFRCPLVHSYTPRYPCEETVHSSCSTAQHLLAKKPYILMGPGAPLCIHIFKHRSCLCVFFLFKVNLHNFM